jgi:hypothetical protein
MCLRLFRITVDRHLRESSRPPREERPTTSAAAAESAKDRPAGEEEDVAAAPGLSSDGENADGTGLERPLLGASRLSVCAECLALRAADAVSLWWGSVACAFDEQNFTKS